MRRFEPTAGRLALDFVNTLAWRDTATPEERLGSFDDLLAWTRAARVVSPLEGKRLAALGRRRPREAREVVERARALREGLHGLFVGFAAGRPPSRSELEVVNQVLASAPQRRRLRRADSKFVWEPANRGGLQSVLWVVAWSAADVLTQEAPRSIRRCEGPGCGWLFLDTSQSRARRWCSMSGCGNRAKARRHYAKRKRTAGTWR